MGKYKFEKELRKSALSGRGNWQTCSQLLLEDAAWFFMNSHQMDAMIGNCENLKGQADMIHREFDFESKELCIEMKVFIPESDAGYGSMEQRFGQSIKQMMEYVTGSLDLEVKGKRIILFVVGRQGISKEILQLINQEIIELLRKAVNMGLELWVAEMEYEQGDDIELLSCKNVVNDILELR